jgi:hypothetical protein
MAKSIKTTNVRRILVEKPATLGNKIRSTFAQRLQIKNVSLKEKPLAHSEVALLLRGPGEVAITETQLAVPLQIDSPEPYWLGANITFEPYLGKYALKSVSIKLYRGPAIEKKTALLRAEWDIPDKNSSYAHAQPHWHAYPGISLEAIPLINSPIEGIEAMSEVPTQVAIVQQPVTSADDISDFHLAMSSSWHVPKTGSHQLLLDDEAGILSWIDGCVCYVIDQLMFLSR